MTRRRTASPCLLFSSNSGFGGLPDTLFSLPYTSSSASRVGVVCYRIGTPRSGMPDTTGATPRLRRAMLTPRLFTCILSRQ
ncbi:hypothetical protein BD311DRAFT_687824 [Dichomitus squalens]|uniref:Uncharacterized protein n=1 Tax=Dichomitus squalens TaxID=114155 RepID=A0A4Q9MWN4_9APHY|nr:hypothetical protein BD311DRAFT_687824 [Dichomitus squalens]